MTQANFKTRNKNNKTAAELFQDLSFAAHQHPLSSSDMCGKSYEQKQRRVGPHQDI